MKLRLGFVSNSSSSSFVCSVCNRHEEGWDLGLDEADMLQCENGHTFCRWHSTECWECKRDYYVKNLLRYAERGWAKGEEKEEYIAEAQRLNDCVTSSEFSAAIDEIDEGRDIYYDYIYNVSAKVCPICKGEKPNEVLSLFFGGNSEFKVHVLRLISSKFDSVDSLVKYLEDIHD